MREAGIDPNDAASIRNFLLKLEESDPDLMALFEEAINNMSPEAPTDLSAMEGSALPPEETSSIPGIDQAAMAAGENLPQPEDVDSAPPSPGSPTPVGTAEGLTNQYKGIRDSILR
jgi:hypothetical protein